MKKAALSSGAELAPTSFTAGMCSGMGVVSTRTPCVNLRWLLAIPSFSNSGQGLGYLASLSDMTAVVGGNR